ncbi:hypothetical protein XELAEV_18022265mg [Xenopus laevis]|uniref:Uncharacterized protein n=1 Tax=Xenopus laevis TaxID=8355 RepID=A0A974HN91_XENLA|nr:hypothetical protein XELAEV_18022265mg [Xenopus laevis]
MSLGRLGSRGRPKALWILSIWRRHSGRSGSSCNSVASIRLVSSVTVSGTPLTRKFPLCDRFSRSSSFFFSCAIWAWCAAINFWSSWRAATWPSAVYSSLSTLSPSSRIC